MAKSTPPEVNRHFFSSDRIPDLFMRSILLSSSNLPQLLFFARKGQKHVLAYPTDHKTGTILHQDREPIRRSISTIKHMNQQGTPFPDTDAQGLFFCVSQPGCKDAFRGPPPTQSQV